MSARLPQLLTHLPEDIPVPASWLHNLGISSALIQKYLASGYLQAWPGQAYFRLGSGVGAVGVLYSLQALGHVGWLGGLSALEQQGYAHQLPVLEQFAVYHHARLPRWATAPTLTPQYSTLFDSPTKLEGWTMPTSLRPEVQVLPPVASQLGMVALLLRSRGPNLPVYSSSPERAILELLDEAPEQGFEGLDTVFEGLSTLRPSSLIALLRACRSIKVKRLFLYLAQRHAHPWWSALEGRPFELGRGKRQIYRGGMLDRTYQITVPVEREHVF